MHRSIKTLLISLLLIGIVQAQEIKNPPCFIASGTITCGTNSLTAGTGGPFLPLTGGTLSGALLGTTANFSGTISGASLSINNAALGSNVLAVNGSSSFAAITGTTANFSSILSADNLNLTSATTFIKLGGTSASFPAIKRNSASIDFRTATDSAYITANLLSVATNNTFVFHTSTATLSNYAGTSSISISNAPTTGNPSKWIAIDDNGTIRRIPTW